jgi:hypothetical protein
MIRKYHDGRSDFARRSIAAMAFLALALVGCGGGDGGPAREGALDTKIITSRVSGSAYLLNIYLPPASAGPRDSLPVVYVLDGESWFATLVDIVESSRTRIIIVGIDSSGQRDQDFVPPNSCTPGGGGHVAYFDFIRQELIPYIEGAIGGDPSQRALFGHSHGGSFVLYAMFSESPLEHSFKAYLASDSSVACMSTIAYGWEQSYASAYGQLPVRLQVSYATLGNYTTNIEYATAVAQRNYGQLAFVAQAYTGTHRGIVPQVLADGIAFAFAGSP